MTTQVPLTKPNLLFYTGASSKQAEKWLDGMLAEGLLDIDTNDDGDIIYTVRGAKRPATGPRELIRCGNCGKATGKGVKCSRCNQLADAKLKALRAELDTAGTALAVLRQGQGALRPHLEGEKNLALAGVLGFFAGPFGWLYAAPMREAIPAIIVSLVILKALGIWFIAPLSALISMLYAWKYNRAGRRTGILTDDDPKSP